MPEHHRANRPKRPEPTPPTPPNPGRWPRNQFVLVGLVALLLIVFLVLGYMHVTP